MFLIQYWQEADQTSGPVPRKQNNFLGPAPSIQRTFGHPLLEFSLSTVKDSSAQKSVEQELKINQQVLIIF